MQNCKGYGEIAMLFNWCFLFAMCINPFPGNSHSTRNIKAKFLTPTRLPYTIGWLGLAPIERLICIVGCHFSRGVWLFAPKFWETHSRPICQLYLWQSSRTGQLTPKKFGQGKSWTCHCNCRWYLPVSYHWSWDRSESQWCSGT